MAGSRTPVQRLWLRGNNRQAAINALNGLNRLINYHASLSFGSGAPRAWDLTQDPNVVTLVEQISSQLAGKYPPAAFPA